MPLYAFKCRNKSCNAFVDLMFPAGEAPGSLGECPFCGDEIKRSWASVQLAPVMQEHYNPSVDGMISSTKQLTETFKVKSDEYSERFGIEARFAPIDPKDVGATNAGLDTTNAVRHARGQREVWVE
jgi:hypothetical protein